MPEFNEKSIKKLIEIAAASGDADALEGATELKTLMQEHKVISEAYSTLERESEAALRSKQEEINKISLIAASVLKSHGVIAAEEKEAEENYDVNSNARRLLLNRY